MLAPELVAEFVQAFTEELATLRKTARSEEMRLQSELAGVSRRLEGVLTAIENGVCNASLKARLNEVEAKQTTLQAQLAACRRPEVPIILHPNAADIYKRRVSELKAALSDPEIRSEAGEELSALIDKIVLTPTAGCPDGLAIDLHGALAAILSMAGAGQSTNTNTPATVAQRAAKARGVESLLSGVAGACNQRWLHLSQASLPY